MDRGTKLLLATIAIGLWANVAVLLFKPITTHAQGQWSCTWRVFIMVPA
jgi:hypothetical protein